MVPSRRPARPMLSVHALEVALEAHSLEMRASETPLELLL